MLLQKFVLAAYSLHYNKLIQVTSSYYVHVKTEEQDRGIGLLMPMPFLENTQEWDNESQDITWFVRGFKRSKFGIRRKI